MVQPDDVTRILFLDDNPERAKVIRRRHPFAVCVTTATAAIAALSEGAWLTVYLDHDLGGEEHADSARADTGMEVVRWVVANRPAVRWFIVHSLNASARGAMVNELQAAGYRAEAVPFSVLRGGAVASS